jgi:hypothetical protein
MTFAGQKLFKQRHRRLAALDDLEMMTREDKTWEERWT